MKMKKKILPFCPSREKSPRGCYINRSTRKSIKISRNFVIKNNLSHSKIAEKCIQYLSSKLAANSDLENFLNYYKSTYDNFYSKRFSSIVDLSMGRISSYKDYVNKRNNIISKNQIPFFVYGLINKPKNLYRIGYSGDTPEGRMTNYINTSLAFKPYHSLTNCHLDVRAIKNILNIPDIYELQPWYLVDEEDYALTLEAFLSIYYNQANNDVGYDLSINNYYNPVIADAIAQAKNGKLKGALNPTFKRIDPVSLSNAIKTEPTMEAIQKKFNAQHHDTIISKIKSFGYAVHGTGSLTDARAYFLRPLIENAVKQNLSLEQCINMCLNEGITFFKNFNMKEYLFNDLCDYIWHEEFSNYRINDNRNIKNATYSRVRKLIIIKEVLNIMENPLVNKIERVTDELNKRGIVIRWEKEVLDILYWMSGSGGGYKQRQDKLLKELFSKYLKQFPVLNLKDIMDKLNISFTSENLKKIRFRIYSLFGINCMDSIREKFWDDEPIFKLFGTQAGQLMQYTVRSLHILKGLKSIKNYPMFTISHLSHSTGLDLRTSGYHINTYLLLIGIIEEISSNKTTRQFRLTNSGKKFLEKVV